LANKSNRIDGQIETDVSVTSTEMECDFRVHTDDLNMIVCASCADEARRTRLPVEVLRSKVDDKSDIGAGTNPTRQGLIHGNVTDPEV
jgi:hypothetical protein